MILSLVAIDALKIVPAHVDIDILRREEEATVQVPVFDGITAAAIEVTAAAIGPRRIANALGHGHNPHSLP